MVRCIAETDMQNHSGKRTLDGSDKYFTRSSGRMPFESPKSSVPLFLFEADKPATQPHHADDATHDLNE